MRPDPDHFMNIWSIQFCNCYHHLFKIFFRFLHFSWLLEWLHRSRSPLAWALWSSIKRSLSVKIRSNTQVWASGAQTRLHRVCYSEWRDVLWRTTCGNWLPETWGIKEMSGWFGWSLCQQCLQIDRLVWYTLMKNIKSTTSHRPPTRLALVLATSKWLA